ncbi:DUF3238 domain-containing protein [Paenibacillus chitinolyticus]|uniref:DUF3238 domain-containing protein n=1 Tax=Paenibacillus chitinolyticus TaxID=79263 RepID=UPI0036DE5B14
MKIAVRVAVWLPFDWILFSDTPSLTTWYAGDGTPAQRGGIRGFNPDSPDYRLAQQVNLTLDGTGQVTDAVPYKNTGISRKKTLEKNLVPPRTLTTSKQALTDNMSYQFIGKTPKSATSPGMYKFRLKAAVSEPFQWYAPDIDYDFTFTVYDSGLVQVQGSHDGFPCYEVYKKIDFQPWETVYTWDGPAKGKDLNALFPPMDVSVNNAG